MSAKAAAPAGEARCRSSRNIPTGSRYRGFPGSLPGRRPTKSLGERLLEDDEVSASVLHVAVLGLLAAGRQLLAVADRRQALRADTERRQVVLGGFRPLRTQRQVVLDGPSLVAVT